MNVSAILSVLNIAAAAIEWFKRRGQLAGSESWPELAAVAVEAMVDKAIAMGATVEQARELFKGAAEVSLLAVGVPAQLAESLATLSADHGVRALRTRVGALAFARAAGLLPELETRARAVLGAFSAKPVVEVRPEDVRMEQVPWTEPSSATSEPASDGLPPLPPSGLSGRKG